MSKDMLENALIDAVTWQTRKWSSFSKFQVFAWMIINSNRKNLNQSENYHKYAHKLFWNACTWNELEDQTFLWSVNKCARVVTKWTQACGRQLAILVSYIHNTSDYRQYCHVGNTVQHCRLGLFQDSDFAGDFEVSKSTSEEESYVSLEAEHLSPISWMCKKQTFLSYSSTESEIVSLDAGLRMEVIPALDLLGRGNWSVTFSKRHCKTK